jgi:hypothetical protein
MEEVRKDFGYVAELVGLEPVYRCVVLRKQLVEYLTMLLFNPAKPGAKSKVIAEVSAYIHEHRSVICVGQSSAPNAHGHDLFCCVWIGRHVEGVSRRHVQSTRIRFTSC